MSDQMDGFWKEDTFILVGEFGSGKTELALHLSHRWAREFPQAEIVLVDLDLVTPYFRSRERRSELEEKGVRVIYPAAFHEGVELPVLPPAVRSAIQTSDRCVVDVGGGEEGTKVLGGLAHEINRSEGSFVLVTNPYRRESSSPDRIVRRARILKQVAGRVKLDGIFANPNLGSATEVQTVVEGLSLVESAAEELGVPIVGVGVSAHLLEGDLLPDRLCKVLSAGGYSATVIDPQMRLQWMN